MNQETSIKPNHRLMSLQSKKTMLLVVAISTAVLIAVGLNYRISLDVIERTIFKHQEDTAQKTADIVEIWMAQQKKILKATIDSLVFDTIGENAQTFLPLHMAMKAGYFTDVYIGLEKGPLLVDGAHWEPPEWYNPRIRPWYVHGVQASEMSFTTPYIDLVTNALVIALVSPLVEGEEVIGVIGADTDLDTLEQNVLKQQISKNSYTFIAENTGTFLIHPNREFVKKENLFEQEKELKEIINIFNADGVKSIRFNDHKGQDSILSFKEISGSNWYLCVIAPFDEAKELTRQNTMVFVIELTLRALGILALIVLFSAGGSGVLVLLLSQRYSSSLEEHKEEITGITKDLKWNIVKRKEVETYYKTLFDVASDGIIMSSALHLSECNHKAEEMFGMSRKELLGATLLDLSSKYQPDGAVSADLLDEIHEHVRKDEQYYFRWYFLKKDQSQFPASVNVKSLKLNDEELLLLSIRDISKRVDAEAKLMQSQKMAAVGEMLGMIAHQWRQPLNTLSTYISSLQAAQINNMLNTAFVDKIVTGADDQIKFMSKTIDNFRNFFKPSKKKDNFNVFDVVFSSVKLMEAQIKNADINLSVANLSGEQTLLIFGYKSEFVHVLINIITNARDALMDRESQLEAPFKKKIEITINGNQDEVFVDITDNGPGISEHSLPLVFNPYYTTKSSKSGTGVGLYMAKMIVEREMGGTLNVTSSPGSTTFSIQLKRVYEDAAQ